MKNLNENWDGINRTPKTLAENVGIRHWTDLADAAKQLRDMTGLVHARSVTAKKGMEQLARSLALAAQQQQDFLQGVISDLEGVKRNSADNKTKSDLDRTIGELKKYRK